MYPVRNRSIRIIPVYKIVVFHGSHD